MAIPGSNYLELTRGNSLLIDITPIDEETSQPIILEDNDRVLFTIYNETRNTKVQKTLDMYQSRMGRITEVCTLCAYKRRAL